MRLRMSLLAAAAALVALAAPSPATAAPDPGWIHWVGPSGEDADAWVRVFGSFGTTMYAGTEGDGVFRSTDNGITWSAFSTGLPPGSDSIRDIDAGATSVTISTDGGLWKSTNGGAWQPIGQGVGPNKLNASVQTLFQATPASPMLAGVVGGLYKSTDSGSTWTPATDDLPAGTTVWSLDAFTWVPNVIYAATSAGAYRSLDGGTSWSPVTSGLPTNTNILRVVVDPQSILTWYAITSGEGVFRSTNGGLTWGPVNNGLGSDIQTRAITLLPVAPGYSDVVVGTQNGLYVSIDKGVSWKKITNDGALGTMAQHPITWAISTIPNLPLALVAGVQGGGVNYRIMVPPVNTAAPTISGTLQVGHSLSSTTGTWEGTATIAFERQWQRCTTASPASCTDIDGETATTYTLQAPDQGNRLRVVVTAENAATPPGYTATSAGNEPSALTALVAANPSTLPGATIRNNPSITPGFGTISVGDTLTASPNTWNPAATSFSYRWYRCTTLNSASCALIPGAGSGTTYVLVDADAGRFIGVDARGTNANGSALSDITVMGTEILPRQVQKTSDPAVLGQPWVGQPLARSVGSYTGPASFFTTWQLCDDAAGNGCSGIAGAGDVPTYTPNGTQAGKFVRVRVEVDVNGFNQFPATLIVTSTPVGPITTAPAKPANTVAPKITGLAVASLVLTANRGTWAGNPTLSQQWLRCSSAGSGCAAIPGAIGLTYRATAADVGRRLILKVTGVNGWGIPAIAQSAATGVVAATLKPRYAGGGAITGKARVGRTLTARKGTWQGVPATLTFKYQWTRGGKRIVGATKATYRVRKADKGKRIGVTVTARNGGGSTVQKLPARKIA